MQTFVRSHVKDRLWTLDFHTAPCTNYVYIICLWKRVNNKYYCGACIVTDNV